MIRILHVVGKMHYGGMETLIMNIYRNIDRQKVQFDFLVHYEEAGEYDEEIRNLGGKIYIMPKTSPKNYFKYKKALHKFFLEHQEYKIIHGHLQSTAFLYHKIAKQTGDRLCITHSHANGYSNNLKERVSYYTALLAQKVTDVFFGCSMSACEAFFPKAIKKDKKMTVIKNGIDTDKYIFNETVRRNIRENLRVQDKLVFAHTGRLTEAKNHTFLLEIFSKIVEKRPESVLLLIGDGPLKEQLKVKVNQLSLNDKVLFLGSRGDVNQLLQGVDLFIMPSLFEGLGIALIEAQAAGIKCFASDTVPKDAKVTDLLEYISLNKSAEYWAEKILEVTVYERQNKKDDIISSGFDISETAKMLTEFYLTNS